MSKRHTRSGPRPRVRFTERDLYTAGDVRVEFAAEAAHRAIHLRALHRTWGVGVGFVVGTSDAGDKVLVGPGFAYDSCGREITLDHPIVLEAPALSAGAAANGWFDIVVCDRPGVPRLRYAYAGAHAAAPPPLSDDLRFGEDVPIARVLRGAAGTLSSLDFSLRRVTRGVSARVMSGRLEKDTALAAGPKHPQSWSVTIDLSAARLTEPPAVFVMLDAHPLMTIAAYRSNIESILGPFITVTALSATSATVNVRFALTDATMFAWPNTTIAGTPVALRWLAVQRVTRGDPVIAVGSAVTANGDPAAISIAQFKNLQKLLPTGAITA